MDPVTLLVMALVKHPSLAASAAERAMRPGTVDVAQLKASLVDLSKGILTCYHRTARFRQTDIVANPWDRAWQYNAETSAVLRIQFEGLSSSPYQMTVAVMTKGNAVRSAVIADSASVHYSPKCELEDWSTPK